MKTRLFPRSARPVQTRRWVLSTLAALTAMGCLGAMLAQAHFSPPPAGASTAELLAWMNQQIQENSLAVTQAANAATASILSDASACAAPETCPSGCSSCTCPEVTDTSCAPCGPVPCNPFTDLVGRWIVVHLDGNVMVCGTLVKESGGFLIVRNDTQTLTVSIRKILYIENC